MTGSARPVVKDQLTDDELAVIVGVKPDGTGAQKIADDTLEAIKALATTHKSTG